MPITKSDIESKLEGYSIRQGACFPKAFEVAGLLFSQQIAPCNDIRCASPQSVLDQIEQAIDLGKIVIFWPFSGYENGNTRCPVFHCHFVFQKDPITSFTVWPNPGPEFFDEKQTVQKICDTIRDYKDIGVHVVPQ